ncbi:MAG: hypothetical protein ACSLE8_06405 [Rhodococcus sp. (in: high G+C Gram-positive bacteria)]
MNSIIATYQQQGYMLTVRQLYYQLVARALIPNTEQSYKRVASVINDGRMAGLIDWDAIEDRTRDVVVRSRWTSGESIVRAVADQYHMDMWEGQQHRLFVIVEKEALAGVMQGVCNRYDVPLLAARGYPSVTVVRDLVLQHLVPAIRNDQSPIILHLGDHDPSGIDMTRDLQDRIEIFLENEGINHQLKRIALNMHQITETGAPPNPAKTTDSRFAEYLKKYGHESWELDALEPAYLDELVKINIEQHIDWGAWNDRKEEIEHVKVKLNRVADNFASL